MPIVRERFRLGPMSREFHPRRLDVSDFAEEAATLSGEDPLQGYERLSAELAVPDADAKVRWSAAGSLRDGAAAGAAIPWLHLSAQTRVPLSCQRCLTPVDVDLVVDRWFRFAPDEATIHRIAWGAVKRRYRKLGGRWVERSGAERLVQGG